MVLSSGVKKRNLPFFNRTTDTFVNLIWFDGWLIGILAVNVLSPRLSVYCSIVSIVSIVSSLYCLYIIVYKI